MEWEEVRGILVKKKKKKRSVNEKMIRKWKEERERIREKIVYFEEKKKEEFKIEMMIKEMNGEMKRIMEYKEKGYKIEKDVKIEVMEEYDFMIEKGLEGNKVR